MLGSGIVPGISNVMVRAFADRLGGVDEIETEESVLRILDTAEHVGAALRAGMALDRC